MSYSIALLPQAEEDLSYWRKTDPQTVVRIKRLLKDISEHPYSGLGKPEPLKWSLSGKWSRRINRKDRETAQRQIKRELKRRFDTTLRLLDDEQTTTNPKGTYRYLLNE